MTLTIHEADRQARAEALNTHASFIVQAPAGSGKTELLIQRFLVLLTQVNMPEEILAITFTKKAANEMRTRLLRTLKQAASDAEPTAEHAKKTWHLAQAVLKRDQSLQWDLLNNPNQLRIQTLDALCAYLTKQLPLLAHFGASPIIAENPTALYREAVEEVLLHLEQNLEWSEAIAQLLMHLDNDFNKLHNLLVNLLAKRDQWLGYIHLDANNDVIRNKLEKHLKNVIVDALMRLENIFPLEQVPILLEIARFAADHLPPHTHSNLIACRNLSSLPSHLITDQTAWRGLANLLLTKRLSWRKRVDEEIGFPPLSQYKNPAEKEKHAHYRKRFSSLIETLQDREDVREALSELFYLPDAQYDETQWEILKALLNVLKIVVAQLRICFQQHGKIDFIENAQAALVALGVEETPTDLALRLDYQIRHILVDEFQDTSFSQYQLLEKLTAGWEREDGRTLFVVGDPMQSIYRFREAEVGLFIRMCHQGIGNIRLKPLTLAVNFRSVDKLVNWNNCLFSKVFPRKNHIGTGAVSYAPSEATLKHVSDEVTVTLKGFSTEEDTYQATEIVAIIQHLQQRRSDQSIAILVRSRSHLSTIIPALKNAQLPYRAVDIDPLATRPAIQDLLALTRALLHPADRIAWLSVLRAPWCGLSLADLLVIAGESPSACMIERLADPTVHTHLSDEGKLNSARVRTLLQAKLSERERYPLRTWVENTWLLLGGPAVLQSEADLADAKAFFNLLHHFSQELPLNLDKLDEKVNHLFADSQSHEHAIQIMTIHSAKGLEFDTVILPHLERKMPSDDKALLAFLEHPLEHAPTALLLAPLHGTGEENNPIYEYIHRAQRIKSAYETDRLLYVAATRAKQQLYLLFNVSKNEKEEYRVETGSFLEKLWSALKPSLLQNIIACDTSELSHHSANQPRFIRRLRSTWKNPLSVPPTPSYQHQQPPGFSLTNQSSRHIGTVCHLILQKIATFGITWWENQGDSQQRYINHLLQQVGTLASELNSSASRVKTIIQTALADARGQWILTPHAEAKSEFSLTTIIDGKPQTLVIDRIFVDEEHVCWIIDYKTTAFTAGEMEQFLQKELDKYLAKMKQYVKAIQSMDKREIRAGLYFPAIPAWQTYL